MQTQYISYDIASGGDIARGSCHPRTLSAVVLASGAAQRGLLNAGVDVTDGWINHTTATQLAAAHGAAMAAYDPASGEPPPAEPDWSQAVEAKADSPATLTSAASITISGAGVAHITITNIPPFSALRMLGPVPMSAEFPDGETLLTITINEPGEYRLRVTSARHLTWEATVNADPA